MPNRRLALLVFLLTAVAFGPALSGDLIRDDVLYVELNPHVTESVPLSEIFLSGFQPETDLGLYRPVTTLSLRLDYLISHVLFGHGVDPRVFHATNLLLAAGAAFLVGILAFRWTRASSISFLAAALFAVHASRSEAVCWISGRAENLMTFFVLSTLVLGTLSRRRIALTLAPMTLLLAFWSKEQGAAALPLLVLAPGLELRRRIELVAVLLPAFATSFLLRWVVLGAAGPVGVQQVLPGVPWTERLALGMAWLADYARLLILPHPLLHEYDDPAGRPAVLQILLGAVVLLAPLALFLFRARVPAWALLLVLIPLLPVLNILYRTGETFGVRFLALPTAGFALAFALAKLPRQVQVALFIVLTLGNVVLSSRRALDYRSTDKLFAAQLRDDPEGAMTHLLLGRQLALRNQALIPSVGSGSPEAFDAVLSTFERAVRNGPHLIPPRHELAKLLFEMSRPRSSSESQDWTLLKRAETETRTLITKAPWFTEGYALLSEVLLLREEHQAAEGILRAGLQQDGLSATLVFQLHRLLDSQKRDVEKRRVLTEFLAALRTIQSARRFAPEPYQTSAQVAFLLGDRRQAEADLRTALARTHAATRRSQIARQLASLLRGEGLSEAANRMLQEVTESLKRRLGSTSLQHELHLALASLAEAEGNRASERNHWEEAFRCARTDAARRRIQQTLSGR